MNIKYTSWTKVKLHNDIMIKLISLAELFGQQNFLVSKSFLGSKIFWSAKIFGQCKSLVSKIFGQQIVGQGNFLVSKIFGLQKFFVIPNFNFLHHFLEVDFW